MTSELRVAHVPMPIDPSLQPFSEDSVDGQLKILSNLPQTLVSETSNLSSAGSTSDREHETPGK